MATEARIRLADIARHAGVSEATVSRVLNSRPAVSSEKRQAVLTALDLLGYQRPARLRTRNSGLIGLIVPELENPTFPIFAQLIEGALAGYGYTPLLCARPLGGVAEDDYVDTLLDRGVSGIIFISGRHADTTADHERYRQLLERPLPIVMINGTIPNLPAAYISCDDFASGQLAVSHLASLGHTKIALINGPERFAPVQRMLAGYRAAVGERGLGEHVELLSFGVEGGQAAADRVLDQEVTGIVCGSDLMALGAVRAARARGLRVPQDVSIVGHDDSLLMAFTDPALTTLRQPILAMAHATVRSLTDQINGHPTDPSEYAFTPELILRGSTAPR